MPLSLQVQKVHKEMIINCLKLVILSVFCAFVAKLSISEQTHYLNY